MSRIVNYETAGKERKHLVRLIGFAIRELFSQNDVSHETKDLAAFIALSLISIYKSIDKSVEAWEKRGYWIKADRYRMEWMWTENLGIKLKESVLEDDWAEVANIIAAIAKKLGDTKLPKQNSNGKFWHGAMNVLIHENTPHVD